MRDKVTPQGPGKNTGYPNQANVSVKPPKKKGSGLLGRIIRRFFLLLFTIIFLVVGALTLVMRHIFDGPSEEACWSPAPPSGSPPCSSERKRWMRSAMPVRAR